MLISPYNTSINFYAKNPVKKESKPALQPQYPNLGPLKQDTLSISFKGGKTADGLKVIGKAKKTIESSSSSPEVVQEAVNDILSAVKEAENKSLFEIALNALKERNHHTPQLKGIFNAAKKDICEQIIKCDKASDEKIIKAIDLLLKLEDENPTSKGYKDIYDILNSLKNRNSYSPNLLIKWSNTSDLVAKKFIGHPDTPDNDRANMIREFLEEYRKKHEGDNYEDLKGYLSSLDKTTLGPKSLEALDLGLTEVKHKAILFDEIEENPEHVSDDSLAEALEGLSSLRNKYPTPAGYHDLLDCISLASESLKPGPKSQKTMDLAREHAYKFLIKEDKNLYDFEKADMIIDLYRIKDKNPTQEGYEDLADCLDSLKGTTKIESQTREELDYVHEQAKQKARMESGTISDEDKSEAIRDFSEGIKPNSEIEEGEIEGHFNYLSSLDKRVNLGEKSTNALIWSMVDIAEKIGSRRTNTKTIFIEELYNKVDKSGKIEHYQEYLDYARLLDRRNLNEHQKEQLDFYCKKAAKNIKDHPESSDKDKIDA